MKLADRYTLQELLGEGGMATVHRAIDKQTGQAVALKILLAEQANDPERCARFLREFTILKELQHSGVVAAYEYYEPEDEPPFFSLELIHGKTLLALIKDAYAQNDSSTKSEPIAIVSVLNILRDLCDTLAYIHSCGIVYCDFTPANIIVLGSGENQRVKLIDFGIARHINLAAEANLPAAGTAYYMAAEQAGNAPPDPRSDIYSFGIVAFQLLTGQPPFNDQDEFTIGARHKAGWVPLVKDRNKTVPVAISTIIQICMEKDPADRYQSIVAVEEALAAVQKRADSTGRIRDTWVERVVYWLAR